VPEDIIDAYVEDKLDKQTARMHFGLMTFSGEIFTFLANTLGNIARFVAKYDVTPGERGKFGGDDLLMYRRFAIRPSWSDWVHMDRAVEKVQVYPDRGSFVGFLESQGWVFKDPEVLLRKLEVHVERGKTKDVLLGYTLDWLTIYRLGSWAPILLTGHELECLSVLSNILFNSRRQLGYQKAINWAAFPVTIFNSQRNYDRYWEALQTGSMVAAPDNNLSFEDEMGDIDL